jgi:hypothetical protein
MEVLNFWENISRYLRFFVSVMLGFLLLLTEPFKNILRTKLGVILFLIGIALIIYFIAIILKNMLNL